MLKTCNNIYSPLYSHSKKFETLFVGQTIEPLDRMSPEYQLVGTFDFPDPDLYENVIFGTQRNSRQGDLQRAYKVGQTYHLDSSPVLTQLPDWVDTTHPQAWAPSIGRHNGNFELWLSMKVKGSGMGIARALGTSLDGQFTITGEPLIYGSGFRFIDQQLSREALFSKEACDWMYYGSMFGPIIAQPLDSTHTTFKGPPIEVLPAGPDKTLARLVEAPIRVDAFGEHWLFVSGCGCFSMNPTTNDHYALLQTKFNSQTKQFEYLGDQRGGVSGDYADSVVLKSTPWFFNPGHPQLYRENDDAEDTLTCLFAAIPWYRDPKEKILAPETPDDKVRYLFTCKLKLIDGRWVIATPTLPVPSYNFQGTTTPVVT